MITVGAQRVERRQSDAGPNVSGRRFYDSASSHWMIKVHPGEFHVTSKADEVLVTVLGSCVAACIRDPRTGFGGMNHFMLAEDNGGGWGNEVMSTRFGNYAMEKLINELIKAGCPRERMEIKVFGGGNVIDSQQAIGTKNAEYVLRYLADEGLKCVAQDLGGDFPRRIQFSPATGQVVRRILRKTDAAPVIREETNYKKTLTPKPRAGEITLFGDD
jgi:chemotaxis protein CheD